jgi:RNA polymerase sigma factor (sigma-70 family)
MKTELTGLVEAARAGSPDAWRVLIDRFQDLAVALAYGRLGEMESARDASQEAVGLAFGPLDELADPAAFPGWFTRLVLTACHRQHRRRRLPTVPLDDVPVATAPGADPAAVVARRWEAERVRSAVEALPEAERMVVALHYLAGLTYPEVAEFLGVGLSAAKKRAHVARGRLKELLPMAADLLARSRPSRDGRFRDTILLFAAIRRHDRPSVERLLARDPGLARVQEDWTPAEAREAGLPYAGDATPLIRAAGAGDIALVRMLVAAGAEPGAPCRCAGAETPLWSATLAGSAEVVAFLLQAGADPNAPAFAGATPLHVAAQRGRDDLARLLLAAGADPDRADEGGRVPADWSRPGWPEAPGPDRAVWVATGIRALDLLAPLRRGCAQRWPAAYGLGQFVVLAEVARALAPATTWWIGFEQAHVDRAEVDHVLSETGLSSEIRLVPREVEPATARARFAEAVDEVLRPAAGPPSLVVCLEAPGHAHDVTLALARLSGAPNVAATLVVERFAGEWPAPGDSVPEGYCAQVAFDRRRVVRRLYPAVDPLTTVSATYPDERHRRLATEARALLAWYAGEDPDLLLADAASSGEPERAGAAQRLLRLLAQPFVVAEPFTSRPGERTGWTDLLDGVEAILPG